MAYWGRSVVMTVPFEPVYVVVEAGDVVDEKPAGISVEVTTERPLRWGETETGVKTWLGILAKRWELGESCR